MFAKLYETEEAGQILVKLDDGDDGAEVRFYFEPPQLGVCSVALNWSEREAHEQWEKADKIFESITQEKALKVIKPVLDQFAT